MSEKFSALKVFSGNSHPELAGEIVRHLGCKLGISRVSQLTDGETRVEIGESVRGADVFIVQPTGAPVNEMTMELLIMLDAFRRASARRITVVMPYYGYARQDLKEKGRQPIAAKVVANLLATSGADRMICMDLHVPQIQGFFDIPLDHLTSVPIFAHYFRGWDPRETVLVSPDMGGVARARELAGRIGGCLAILDNKRLEPTRVQISGVIGEVRGKHVIMIDDIIATASTVKQGACFLAEAGALSVSVCATHPLLTGRAAERLADAPVRQVIVTDTLPIPAEKRLEKLQVLSVGKLLADSIQAIHTGGSVSRLFC